MKPLTALSLREEYDYLSQIDVSALPYGEQAIEPIRARLDALRRALSLYRTERMYRDVTGAPRWFTLEVGTRAWTTRLSPPSVIELKVTSVSSMGRAGFSTPTADLFDLDEKRTTSVFPTASDALSSIRRDHEDERAYNAERLRAAKRNVRALTVAKRAASAAIERASAVSPPYTALVIPEPIYPEAAANAQEGERLVARLVADSLRANHKQAQTVAVRRITTADCVSLGIGGEVFFYTTEDSGDAPLAPLSVYSGIISTINADESMNVACTTREWNTTFHYFAARCLTEHGRAFNPRIFSTERAAYQGLVAFIDEQLNEATLHKRVCADKLADAEARRLAAIADTPILSFEDNK